MKSQRTIFLSGIILSLLGAVPALSADLNDPNSFWAYRAAYWDGRYPSAWAGGGQAVRDTLEYTGYEILDADQLKAWMDARINDAAPSVVVFCQDIAPDTVLESMSPDCTLRHYLDAGGKIVWYADIPMYYQGHVDGARTTYEVAGSTNVLGFNAADAPWDSEQTTVLTSDGVAWGLTETWPSTRPTSTDSVRVLAEDADGHAAAWVKHYVAHDDYRGFVRFFDQSGEPNLDDLRRVAEYPDVPEPIVFNNQAESEEDIVGVFFYPWYENPNTSGRWTHWQEPAFSPPTTWSANYLPNYPDAAWNPGVRLYDSKDPEVLRWQDRAMARAGVDIAVASWWRIGGHEDAGLAKAIRICKSVQWCIYYEMEAYDDPTAQRICNDIKYVVDTYGPTRNYAKVDDRWLVLVYGAGGDETADRWRQAKTMLAEDGYHVYLNGDRSSGAEPWDAVHNYHPVVYQGFTQTLANVDDSAWISPGFWAYGQNPTLQRSLGEFALAWHTIVENRNSYRFVLIETWNEWHEGTQIEPGQEIIPDPQGFVPRPDGDYGYTFIDTIAPAAVDDLQWTSPGHRPVVPARLEAQNIIWDNDNNVTLLEEDPNKVLIREEDVRIGSSILVPYETDSNEVIFNIRANSISAGKGRVVFYPKMGLYVDDSLVFEWEVQGAVPTFGIESDDHNYSAAVHIGKGIHKAEVAMTSGGEFGDLIVDFIDINALFIHEPEAEGFETGNFSQMDWNSYGDSDWFVTSGPSHSGTYSARAGSIDHDENSTLEVTLDCVSGDIRFYCKVSSESGFDYLRFYIDDEEKDRWSGEDDWTEVTFAVLEGRRTFRWEYSKDGSASDGDDTAWIDDIVFPVN